MLVLAHSYIQHITQIPCYKVSEIQQYSHMCSYDIHDNTSRFL